MQRQTAAAYAAGTVARVRDDPAARLAVMREPYRGGPGQRHLPFRRGAVAFMSWQLQRNLLNAPHAAVPGSPWWRAVNERLIRDGYEARALAAGYDPAGSTPSAQASVDFVRRPNARSGIARTTPASSPPTSSTRSLPARRAALNAISSMWCWLRALRPRSGGRAAPRAGVARPAAPLLGDPRIGMTGIFMSLSRILPDRYPLGDDVEPYLAIENRFGHLLDFGLIRPRLARLYQWSADELRLPGLLDLFDGHVPTYAWPAGDTPWDPEPSSLARLARRALP